MKTLIFLTILSIWTSNKCFSQLTLTKKTKSVSLDTNRVWSIKSNSVRLLSYWDYRYRKRINKYPAHLTFRVDSIKQIVKMGDTLKVSAVLLLHYIDTLDGTISSISEADNHWNNRNRRVLKDTTFLIRMNDIYEMQVQTKPANFEDNLGMAAVGMFVIGTVGTVVGTVEVLKGHPYGYLAIGGGVAFLGYLRHELRKSKWFDKFKIGEKDWKIVAK
jgi:hypothetical protein